MHIFWHVGTLLYPFLLALYPILFLYTNNSGQFHPNVLTGPMALSLGLTLVLCTIARLVTRDARRASMIAAAGLTTFFAYGHVFSAVYVASAHAMVPTTLDGNLAAYEWRLQWVLCTAMFFFTALAIRSIAKLRDEPLTALTRALTVGALTLMTIIGAEAIAGATSDLVPSQHTKRKVTPTADPTKPDIYQIVLDGYARQDILAQHFGFDNARFLGALEDDGFQVLGQARANFYWTPLSLASMLNLRYVDYLADSLGRETTDIRVPFEMLRDSEVSRFLKSRGYSTVHLGSTWAGTMENPTADVEIQCATGWFQNDFYRALAESSLFRVFRSRITIDLATCHLAQLEALERTATLPGPKYVFAHFIPPHHPYLFDRHGTILTSATVVDQFQYQNYLWSRRDLYTDQLHYMNDRVQHVVRSIISQSRRPALIILHSDHGPQLIDNKGAKQADDQSARFGVFLAIRTPDESKGLPSDLNLVNVYRLLLNRYFNEDLPLLPPSQFYSPFSKPYAFERVAW